MHCEIETKAIEEINTTNILPQTSFWAMVKNRHGFMPQAFRVIATDDLVSPGGDGSRKTGDDMLVLLKYINENQCFAYTPYGPKIEPDFENHGIFLEELSEVLRPHLPDECLFIRYDLPWENQWAQENDRYGPDNFWKGPPSPGTQEMRLNFNTHNWNLQKSPGNILPANTFFIDLEKDEEQILDAMKPKTRYNIRLACRKGVRVKEYGIEKFDDWYALYLETAIRNDLAVNNRDFFRPLFIDRNGYSEDVGIRLLMADHDGEFLAGLFLARSGQRATYLYGASSSRKRNFMASHALQWEAIRLAR